MGKAFVEAFVDMKRKHNVTLVAVMHDTGKTSINPTDYELRPTDSLVVIAAHDYDDKS